MKSNYEYASLTGSRLYEDLNAIYLKNPFLKAQSHSASLKLEYSVGNSVLTSVTAY